MQTRWLGPLLLVLVCLAHRSAAQQPPAPAEAVLINAGSASTWTEDRTSVVQLEGPVRIELDGITLTGQQAVVWISPVQGSVANLRHVEVSLVGDANLIQANLLQRSGNRLYTDAFVRGPVRLTADRRRAVDQRSSELYRTASALRPVLLKGGEPSGQWVIEDEPLVPTAATTQPVDRIRPLNPIRLSSNTFYTTETPEGKVVAVLTGNVVLFQRNPEGDFVELRAENVVVFTAYSSLKQLAEGERSSVEMAASAAYLEGDVRITRTPAKQTEPDQRLMANRAYYDFTTDRAVLTDVVLHTTDPRTRIPIVLRARMMRQLSEREYTAEKARISTSTFHTPSYSIGASRTYMRTVETGNEVTGDRTYFTARDATFDIGATPVFYLPAVAGSVTERNLLRQIETSQSRAFGFGVLTEWGLFESLGRVPPRGVDASYTVGYYTDRGPVTGLDAEYVGGSVDSATLEPWSYSGNFRSFLVYDSGKDDLGRRRLDIEPEDEVRGRFYLEHQHFLPGDWQIQVSGGYISDPTFLEEWFNREFRSGRPRELALYAKHQRDSEAITFLVSGQPHDFATVAEFYQEQAEIERLPELGYRRIGDSWFDDKATFFSENTLAGLRFKQSDYTLEELGFRQANIGAGRFSPGLPSFGQTGMPSDTTYRGDFRQELDWPFSISRFRVVPYIVGRYTEYTESVDGGSAERVHAGAGIRTTTAFWKVDDTVRSPLLDLNRLRHVVEPEINAYTSVQSEDRENLLIYDEPIDAITDVSAVQLALNQRWQTKRGGPGQWRSVDAFTFNIAYNLFLNQPPERELHPTDFRGLYFISHPEASIPRRSVNAEFKWQVSDTVAIHSDANYNTEEAMLATAAIGLSVRHDTRLRYQVAWRHMGLEFTELVNGNTFLFEDRELFIAAIDYQLTPKYRVQLANAYDFAHSRNDRSTVSLVRRFDRLYAAISFRVDNFQNENAIFFNIWPEGMQPGGGSAAAQRAFGGTSPY